MLVALGVGIARIKAVMAPTIGKWSSQTKATADFTRSPLLDSTLLSHLIEMTIRGLDPERITYEGVR